MTGSEELKAGRLEDLYARIQRDPGYRTAAMAGVFVPGRGSLRDGAVVLVGEAPGKDEEKTGRPFVGAAGKNLDRLLEASGMVRDELFVTNVIKYRPIFPDGKTRNPSVSESKRALPFLLREMEILAPRLAVCLGLCAARALVGENLVMERASGTVFHRFGIDILVSYHPSPFNFMIAKKREEMLRVFRLLKRYGERPV